jgi:hypothetical protein
VPWDSPWVGESWARIESESRFSMSLFCFILIRMGVIGSTSTAERRLVLIILFFHCEVLTCVDSVS